jgi:hypothetical protein
LDQPLDHRRDFAWVAHDLERPPAVPAIAVDRIAPRPGRVMSAAEQAKSEFDKVLEFKPDHMAAHVGLAQIVLGKGDKESAQKAVDHLDKALKIAEDFSARRWKSRRRRSRASGGPCKSTRATARRCARWARPCWRPTSRLA